jgi:hypothetical protein
VVLVLRVLQHLLGLARAAQRVQRTLRRGDRATGDVRDRLGHGVGARQTGRRLGLAAKLLDAPLEQLRVLLRLLQVLLQTLLVRRARRERDVRLERLLELLLLAIRLVQILDDLGVPSVDLSHGQRLLSQMTCFPIRNPNVRTHIADF